MDINRRRGTRPSSITTATCGIPPHHHWYCLIFSPFSSSFSSPIASFPPLSFPERENLMKLNGEEFNMADAQFLITNWNMKKGRGKKTSGSILIIEYGASLEMKERPPFPLLLNCELSFDSKTSWIWKFYETCFNAKDRGAFSNTNFTLMSLRLREKNVCFSLLFTFTFLFRLRIFDILNHVHRK